MQQPDTKSIDIKSIDMFYYIGNSFSKKKKKEKYAIGLHYITLYIHEYQEDFTYPDMLYTYMVGRNKLNNIHKLLIAQLNIYNVTSSSKSDKMGVRNLL